MLAAASIGAIWSSTSPDFGINVSSPVPVQSSPCWAQTQWGWWVRWLLSLQPCCHLLAQPSTPELFLLLSVALLISTWEVWEALAAHSWDIFTCTPWSWGAFIILNVQMSSSAVWAWLFFPNPVPGLATLQFPHSQFLCPGSPILCLLSGWTQHHPGWSVPQGFICQQWGISH